MAKRNKLIPLKERIKDLESAYLRMEDFIRNRLFGFVVYTDEKARKLKKEIFKKIEKQDQKNAAWIAVNIPKAYNESSAIAKERLERLKLKPKRKGFEASSKKSKLKEMRAAAEKLNFANREIEKRVNSFFRLMKKAYKTLKIQNTAEWWSGNITEQIEEIKIASVIPRELTTRAGYSYMAVPTRRDVQEGIKKVFNEAFGEFDFIRVPLKNGGFRNYSPDVYCKLVARTRLIGAQVEATVNRTKQHGIKYVQVTDHANACPICVPFAGQIYTIEGEDLNYPPLVAPPYHPNCQHSVFPITPDVIAANAKDPRVPNPPKPAWGLTVDKQLKILTEQRRAA